MTFMPALAQKKKGRIEPGRIYVAGETLYAPRFGFSATVPTGWEGLLPRESEVFLLTTATSTYGEIFVFGREQGDLNTLQTTWTNGVDLSETIKLKAKNPAQQDGLLISEVVAVGQFINKGFLGFAVAKCNPAGLPNWASRVQPVMKKVNWVFAAATVGLSWLVYGEGLLRISLPAGFALVIYFIIMTLGSYAGGIGLVPHQRLVLAVGSGTRNLGVAIAPLVSLPVIDERTIGMIVLAAPVMVLTSLGSSRIFQLRMAGSPPSLR